MTGSWRSVGRHEPNQQASPSSQDHQDSEGSYEASSSSATMAAAASDDDGPSSASSLLPSDAGPTSSTPAPTSDFSAKSSALPPLDPSPSLIPTREETGTASTSTYAGAEEEASHANDAFVTRRPILPRPPPTLTHLERSSRTWEEAVGYLSHPELHPYAEKIWNLNEYADQNSDEEYLVFPSTYWNDHDMVEVYERCARASRLRRAWVSTVARLADRSVDTSDLTATPATSSAEAPSSTEATVSPSSAAFSSRRLSVVSETSEANELPTSPTPDTAVVKPMSPPTLQTTAAQPTSSPTSGTAAAQPTSSPAQDTTAAQPTSALTPDTPVVSTPTLDTAVVEHTSPPTSKTTAAQPTSSPTSDIAAAQPKPTPGPVGASVVEVASAADTAKTLDTMEVPEASNVSDATAPSTIVDTSRGTEKELGLLESTSSGSNPILTPRSNPETPDCFGGPKCDKYAAALALMAMAGDVDVSNLPQPIDLFGCDYDWWNRPDKFELLQPDVNRSVSGAAGRSVWKKIQKAKRDRRETDDAFLVRGTDDGPIPDHTIIKVIHPSGLVKCLYHRLAVCPVCAIAPPRNGSLLSPGEELVVTSSSLAEKTDVFIDTDLSKDFSHYQGTMEVWIAPRERRRFVPEWDFELTGRVEEDHDYHNPPEATRVPSSFETHLCMDCGGLTWLVGRQTPDGSRSHPSHHASLNVRRAAIPGMGIPPSRSPGETGTTRSLIVKMASYRAHDGRTAYGVYFGDGSGYNFSEVVKAADMLDPLTGRRMVDCPFVTFNGNAAILAAARTLCTCLKAILFARVYGINEVAKENSDHAKRKAIAMRVIVMTDSSYLVNLICKDLDSIWVPAERTWAPENESSSSSGGGGGGGGGGDGKGKGKAKAVTAAANSPILFDEAPGAATDNQGPGPKKAVPPATGSNRTDGLNRSQKAKLIKREKRVAAAKKEESSSSPQKGDDKTNPEALTAFHVYEDAKTRRKVLPNIPLVNKFLMGELDLVVRGVNIEWYLVSTKHVREAIDLAKEAITSEDAAKEAIRSEATKVKAAEKEAAQVEAVKEDQQNIEEGA